jgi:hypothetical protein
MLSKSPASSEVKYVGNPDGVFAKGQFMPLTFHVLGGSMQRLAEADISVCHTYGIPMEADLQNIGGGTIVPLHRASIVVVPEFCVRVAPTRFIRQLVEVTDSNRIIVSYDWVSACLSQGRLVDIETFKLQSSPLGDVDTASRGFNQYRSSDLISIQLEELAQSMDPIEETASSDTGPPDDDDHSEVDFFASIYAPASIHQNHLLDRLVPLVPSSAAGLYRLPQHAQTDDIRADADQSPKGDASILVQEVSHATPPQAPNIAAPLDTLAYDDWGNPIEDMSSFELAQTEWPENEPDHESYVSDDDGQWVSLSLVDRLMRRG